MGCTLTSGPDASLSNFHVVNGGEALLAWQHHCDAVHRLLVGPIVIRLCVPRSRDADPSVDPGGHRRALGHGPAVYPQQDVQTDLGACRYLAYPRSCGPARWAEPVLLLGARIRQWSRA